KIIKDAEAGGVEEARRTPAEVLADHHALGAGGTCFALTATMLHLVRALGFPAEPILADRRYGADTHSGDRRGWARQESRERGLDAASSPSARSRCRPRRARGDRRAPRRVFAAPPRRRRPRRP